MTLRRNTADWEAVQLNQKVLVDASRMDTSVELFGQKLAMPLVLAPVGMGGMTARRGEVQAKRAADKAGIPFCLSTVGICPMEEVSQAGGLGPWGRLRSGVIDYMLHPRWAVDVGLRGGPHGFGNIAPYVQQSKNPRDYLNWTGSQFDSSVTWADIEWLRQVWPGKLVLKGILDVADARDAVRVGADGLIVSNHGGRQLDGVASTAAMLPRIADAVGTETTLLVDGGIRSGQDLVRALALGAKAALVGRPWVMALAAGGEAALTRMLGLIKQDMRTALGLTGIPNARDVTRAALLEQ